MSIASWNQVSAVARVPWDDVHVPRIDEPAPSLGRTRRMAKEKEGDHARVPLAADDFLDDAAPGLFWLAQSTHASDELAHAAHSALNILKERG